MSDRKTYKTWVLVYVPQKSRGRAKPERLLITYADFDHLWDLTACRLQDGLDVLAALRRLLRDRARHQLARAVGGDLTSHPHLAGGFDGLAVWSSGCLCAEMNGQCI